MEAWTRFLSPAPRVACRRSSTASRCYGRLAANPARNGRTLQRELAGRHSARVGPYRVLYRIDEPRHAIVIARVEHRSAVYRPR
jgi:mRNA-degrading endonuclease RelE of RelBE toxin-antitoxin system